MTVEHDLKIPPPLDPHVASLGLRTASNNPTEYFDLRLTASFGKEIVLLDSGGETIEVNLAIKKAEIKFHCVNASLHLIESHARDSEAWQGKSDRVREVSRKSEASVGGSISSDSLGFAKISTSGSAQFASEQRGTDSLTRAALPWRILNSDAIQLGYLDDFERELHGRIVDEDVSLRVRPLDTSRHVGVLARIRVRESWIEISDATIQKDSPKLRKYWQGLARKDSASEQRRRLFNRLLAHLITRELQDHTDNRNATIAAAAIVMKPATDAFIGQPTPRQRQKISIDPTAVENFLKSDLGDEGRVLREIGVQLEDEDSDVNVDAIIGELLRNFSAASSPYYSRMRHISELVYFYAHSLGLQIDVSASTSYSTGTATNPGRRSLSVFFKFLEKKNDCKSTKQLLEEYSSHRSFPSTFLEAGVLLKGDRAYRFAKALGFALSYQSFQRRLAEYGVRTGHGFVFTYRDVALAVGASDALSRLVGRTLLVNMPQIEFLLD